MNKVLVKASMHSLRGSSFGNDIFCLWPTCKRSKLKSFTNKLLVRDSVSDTESVTEAQFNTDLNRTIDDIPKNLGSIQVKVLKSCWCRDLTGIINPVNSVISLFKYEFIRLNVFLHLRHSDYFNQ